MNETNRTHDGDLEQLRLEVFGDPIHGPGARYALSRIGPLTGAAVADMGCGIGAAGIMFALLGASTVAGVDINDGRIELARGRASELGVDDRCSFSCRPVEETGLTTEAFDVVFSKGVLQYVDRRRALTEYMRVLKPGGSLILIENLPHNPFILFYRGVRRLRARTADEKAYVASIRGYVSRAELDGLRPSFDAVESRYFHLLSAPMAGLGYSSGPPRASSGESGAAKFDAAVLSRVPAARRLAWIVAAVHLGKHTEPYRY